jgi:hypothetical protein
MHNERYNPMCTVATVKHDAKLMVWGCFTYHGVGKLYWIPGIMNKRVYQNILETQMIPSAEVLFPDDNYIFQQDNDPKHTANDVRDFLDAKGIDRTAWPAQSPDLNPIENLWSILNLNTQLRTCNSLEALFETLTKAWHEIPVGTLNRLVDSMPDRCRAVIRANGFATKY